MRLTVPLRERESPWVDRIDLVAGRLPRFLFGFSTGDCLPVFRFSRVTRQLLEPYLVYLMQNGYHTLCSREVAEVVRGERTPGSRDVVLTFDHAWASLWTVAAPLLRRYDQRAVAFAIPGRVEEGGTCRPPIGEAAHDPDVDHSDHPFANWTELRRLAEEGRIDLQSNGWSHGKIFTNEKFLRLVEPETRIPHLSWPMVSDTGEPLRFLAATQVFHPLLPSRSRLSDGMRHEVDPSVVRRIHDDPDAAPYLFKQHFLQIETEQDREDAIRYELTRSREELEARLGTPVRQFCFPWGVCGRVASALVEAAGYETAFADRRCRFRAVRAGMHPFRLGRLPYYFIRALPGARRKRYWRIRNPASV